jgi:hypothetical protein
MENLKNQSAANRQIRKSNFSIENILSRPESSEQQTRAVNKVLFRQNPFQNNHVLFTQNLNHNFHQNNSLSENLERNNLIENNKANDENNVDDEDDLKMESESMCHSENSESGVHDPNEDTRSDEGNSSSQSKRKRKNSNSTLYENVKI